MIQREIWALGMGVTFLHVVIGRWAFCANPFREAHPNMLLLQYRDDGFDIGCKADFLYRVFQIIAGQWEY